MLVLTRKLGEKILIGDDITITVIDIGKSRVRLGIKAPAGHQILREELVEEVGSAAPGRRDQRADAGMMRTEIVSGRRPSGRRKARAAELIDA